MSSQAGTEASGWADVTPLSYGESHPVGRVTQLGVGIRCPGVDLELAGDSAVLGPSGWALDGFRSEGAVMSDPTAQLNRFYADLLHELGEFARRPSATAIGAAVVVKRVAQAHGVESAERLPLPRLNRAEREEQAETRRRSDQ